jgi:HEAT repeat protein
VELKRENAVRLAGEGIPRDDTTTTPVVKPKGSELNEFFGFVEFVFYKFPKQAINLYLGNTPGRYARMMEDDQSADVRRTGILRLVTDFEFARKDPYTRRYWQIAQGDPNYLVRVAAIRALDRSRKSTVTPIAIKTMDDPNPLLRLEAAKALANVPDQSSIPALIRHMNPIIDMRGESGRMEQVQESRDVRVACADALRNFPNRDVTTALVDVLRDKDFEVSWQARKSLVLLTGHDFKYDQNAWRDYFTKAEKPFG